MTEFPNTKPIVIKKDDQELTFVSLSEEQDIQISYYDKDLLLIDNIAKFAEISSARVEMSSVVICLRGKVSAKMGDKELELHSNQVAMIPPNSVVSDIMISPDFEVKALFMTSSIIRRFFEDKISLWNNLMYVSRNHFLSLSEIDMKFYRAFYEMLNICFSQGYEASLRKEVIHSLIRCGLLAICGAMKDKMNSDIKYEESGSSNALFQKFIDLITDTPAHKQTVKSMAAELCVSPKYLSFVCKKHSGKSASEWITEQTLENISYDLKHTNTPIKQICDSLGFPNSSFFGRYVKKHFGMTPLQYRRKG